MSDYYNAKRTYGLFRPDDEGIFKLSRSKIDLFLNCPRCFYLDRRLGVGRPPMFPYTLNSAVDALLKKEFDIHRAKGEAHPMMKHYKIDAIPFKHEKMDEWRNNFTGIQYLHKPTNLLIFGAIDDVWINPDKELIIVDYKSTSKDGDINLDADWQIGYKRQMEIYQWLFRKNDFKVSNIGYFVYANGIKDKEAFDKLVNSVSISGDYMVVGAHEEGHDKGAAYVFYNDPDNPGDAWVEVKKLTAIDGSVDDYFGISVAIDGDYLWITDSSNGASYKVWKNGTYTGISQSEPASSVHGLDMNGTYIWETTYDGRTVEIFKYADWSSVGSFAIHEQTSWRPGSITYNDTTLFVGSDGGNDIRILRNDASF